MCEDFNEKVILIMQHPIMNGPLNELGDTDMAQAYELLMELAGLSVDDQFTRLDYIQSSRIHFAMGELAYLMDGETDEVCRHFYTAYTNLQKGGFDLSIRKWAELVSVHSKEE